MTYPICALASPTKIEVPKEKLRYRIWYSKLYRTPCTRTPAVLVLAIAMVVKMRGPLVYFDLVNPVSRSSVQRRPRACKSYAAWPS